MVVACGINCEKVALRDLFVSFLLFDDNRVLLVPFWSIIFCLSLVAVPRADQMPIGKLAQTNFDFRPGLVIRSYWNRVLDDLIRERVKVPGEVAPLVGSEKVVHLKVHLRPLGIQKFLRSKSFKQKYNLPSAQALSGTPCRSG